MTGGQMPSHLQLISERKRPGLDKWERDAAITSRLTFSSKRATALGDGAVTRFMLGPFPVIISMFVSEGVQRQNICRWFFIKWSDSQAPSSSSGWIFLNVFFSHKMGTLWHSLPNDSFSCVHLLQGDRLFITYRASWENYGENFLDRQGKMQLINSACND